MRPSTSTAPLTVVAGCGKTYPLPRNRASGDSQSGTACSGGAPPPNESRHPMAWPPASTEPLQAAELSLGLARGDEPGLMECPRLDRRPARRIERFGIHGPSATPLPESRQPARRKPGGLLDLDPLHRRL